MQFDRCICKHTVGTPTLYAMAEANTAATAVTKRLQKDAVCIESISHGEFIAITVMEEAAGTSPSWYLVYVVQSCTTLLGPATDDYDNTFGKNSRVLTGVYLERVSTREHL